MSKTITQDLLVGLTAESYAASDALHRVNDHIKDTGRQLQSLRDHSRNTSKAIATSNKHLETLTKNSKSSANALKNLGPNGFDMASSAIGATTGLLNSFGIELTGTPAKILGIVNASIRMGSAFTKLNNAVNAHITAQEIANSRTEAATVSTNANTKAMGTETKVKKISIAADTQRGKVIARNNKLMKKGIAAKTLGIIKLGIKAAAQWLLNLAKMANPAMLLVAGIMAVGAAIAGVVRFFSRASRETRRYGFSMEDLADKHGVSTDEIESDMERMGTTSIGSWNTMQEGAIEFAETFGGNADAIREEIIGLIDEHTNYEQAMQLWGQQRQILDDVSGAWGVTTDDIKADLEAMGMSFTDDGAIEAWEAAQMDALEEVASGWNMTASELVDHAGRMNMSVAEMSQVMEDFHGDVQSNVGGIINGFRKIPTEYQRSSEELREIMAANIAATANWQNNMGELMNLEGVSADMIAHLESKGPEFNSVIQEMLDCEDELRYWIQLFDDATAVATEGALANIEDDALRDGIATMLEETGQAIGLSTEVLEGYQQMAAELTERMLEEAEESGQAIGESYMEHTAQGITAGTDEAVAAFETGMNEIQSAATESFDGLNETMATKMEVIQELISEGLAQIKYDFSRLKEPIETAATESMEKFGQATVEGLSEVATKVENKLNEVQIPFDELPEKLSESAKNSMYQFKAGLYSGLPETLVKATEIVSQVTEKFNGLQDNLETAGINAMTGLLSGIESQSGAVMSAVQRIVDGINNAFSSAIQGANSARSNIASMSQGFTYNPVFANAPSESLNQVGLLEEIRDAIHAGKNIIMDTGELVGATYHGYDCAAGAAISYNKRWGR